VTSISFTAAGLIDRLSASRQLMARQAANAAGLSGAPGRASDPSRASGTAAGTTVTLGAAATGGASSAVYARPVAAPVSRAWATPPASDDAISQRMARNLDARASLSLADQWSGLGGALLTRFAQAPGTYRQALASDVPAGADLAADVATAASATGAGVTASAVAGTQAPGDAPAVDPTAAALASLDTGATSVALSIRTRSGLSVQLGIQVNQGDNADGIHGLKVEISGSKDLSEAEKAAVAALASGLDKALEGLGQLKAAGLDLSGLTGFDRSVLGSIDLDIKSPRPGAALGSFSLHLGEDKNLLSMSGAAGKLHLKMDPTTAQSDVAPTRKWASIQQYLERIDAAASRGHYDRGVVDQMKDAFQQLQAPGLQDAAEPTRGGASAAAVKGAAASGTPETAGAGSQPSTALAVQLKPAVSKVPQPGGQPTVGEARPPVQAAETGLADFEAGFEADFIKTNRIGSAREAGHGRYQLSQATHTETDPSTEATRITQSVTEQLDSRWQRSLDGGTLRVDLGRYTAHEVKDSSTVSTLIDVARDGRARAARQTDETQSQTDSLILDHRPARVTGTPVHRRWTEPLSL